MSSSCRSYERFRPEGEEDVEEELFGDAGVVGMESARACPGKPRRPERYSATLARGALLSPSAAAA